VNDDISGEQLAGTNLVGNSEGFLEVKSADLMGSFPSGTYPVQIFGRQTPLDFIQLLGTGTITYGLV